MARYTQAIGENWCEVLKMCILDTINVPRFKKKCITLRNGEITVLKMAVKISYKILLFQQKFYE